MDGTKVHFHALPFSWFRISIRNRSAENLYGWKDSEVIGQSATELLVAEDHYAHLKKIMERLSFGQSWSGRFPFKKRSGDLFMALVTKSPLYEEGELAGIVTVSSDAAIFNTENSQNRARLPRLNLKKIQWNPRPPIAPVTQIASSVSNLVLMCITSLELCPLFFCSRSI